MFPITTRMGGMSQAFPDTCKTPAPSGTVPVPYPNIAAIMQVNPATCSMKVSVINQPVCHNQSTVTMTSGDEAGTAGGGVVSNMIKGPAKFTLGSMKVSIEGKPAAYQTCPMGQNGTNANAFGAQMMPSQAKVLIGP